MYVPSSANSVIILALSQTSVPPKDMTKFTEDSLLRHAQFICDQVLSFDDSAEVEDALLITTPCMRSLAHYGGVTLGKRTAVRRAPSRKENVKQSAWTKATTTKLVSDMFENIFTDQLAKHDDDNKIKMVCAFIVEYYRYIRDEFQDGN